MTVSDRYADIVTHTTRDPVAATAGAHHATYLTTSHFGSLDGLRFLSIVMVLWHHSPLLGHVGHDAWGGLAGRGYTGVDFFFVLSGFLITTLLLRGTARTGSFSLGGFYWRRALRILPPYYLIVTLVGIYFVLIEGRDDLRTLWPLYYVFVANFMVGDINLLTPTWSLSVEEQFYLVWPLLLLCVPGRWILPVLTGLIAVTVLGTSGAFDVVGIAGFDLGRLYISMPPYAPILIGAGVALLLHSPRGFAVLWRVLGHPAAPLLTLTALVVALLMLPQNLLGWPNLVMHLIMAACVTSITIREDHWLRPLTTLRLVTRIGAISYGIYLYHLIGRHFAVALSDKLAGGNLMVLAVAYILFSVLLAEISFRYFESRFLALRHYRPFRVRRHPL